jgi:hypothetical protein
MHVQATDRAIHAPLLPQQRYSVVAASGDLPLVGVSPEIENGINHAPQSKICTDMVHFPWVRRSN